MERTYKPEGILQIQMATRILMNDALGRYVHDPTNLPAIQGILRNGLTSLTTITSTQHACPPGFSIVGGACTVNVKGK